MMDVGPEALDLLTVDEVAKRLRLSSKTVWKLVYAWRNSGGAEGIESVKVGTRRLIAPEAVIDFKKRLQAAARKGAA